MDLEPTYLCITSGETREALAAWRLFTSTAPAMLLREAAIPWPACWCLLRVKTSEAIGLPAGDIDAIVGRLTSETPLLEQLKEESALEHAQRVMQGQRFFPLQSDKLTFDLSYLVGLEIKCAYLRPPPPGAEGRSPELKSLKNGTQKQRGLQDQLEHLLNLGLDKVYLLDIIAGLPLVATTLSEVFAGVALSCNAVDACHERLKYPGFAPNLPIGHLKMIIGPDRGFTEDLGGFRHAGTVRSAPDNPHRSDLNTQARRERLQEHLYQLLEKAMPTIPPQIPVVVDQCPRCERLGEYHNPSACPDSST